MKTDPESNDWIANRRCHDGIAHEDLLTELRARRLWNQLVNDMGQLMVLANSIMGRDFITLLRPLIPQEAGFVSGSSRRDPTAFRLVRVLTE